MTYLSVLVFLFTATASTDIYTLSLHDALPIFIVDNEIVRMRPPPQIHELDQLGDNAQYAGGHHVPALSPSWSSSRSEEHTSELQSLTNLVCRLLLEKKKKTLIDVRIEAHNTTR